MPITKVTSAVLADNSVDSDNYVDGNLLYLDLMMGVSIFGMKMTKLGI